MRNCGFLLLIALLACSGRLAAQEFSVGDFVFAVPKDWELQTPSSAMRKAELKVSDAKTGESAETVFFYFGPGQGGSVADNIARWRGQVADLKGEKIEEKEIARSKVTLVKFPGTYQSGMPGGPKLPREGSILLGAILESAQGNVFVRLTGPAKLVEKIEKDFAAMIEAGAKNRRG